MQKIFSLSPAIDRDRLYSRLNIINGTSAHSAANSYYDELRHLISERIPVKAGFCLPLGGLSGEAVAAGLVTAGSHSDKYVQQAFAESAMKGFLLDAMINEALFSACRELEKTVRHEAADKLVCRFSGDEGSSLDKQGELLRVSGLGRLMNVEVNELGVLIPLKSMLFVASKVSQGACDERIEKCDECNNEVCPYRLSSERLG